ncbi:uncharacterized protein JN550_003081 [Neoarthrinium moseri]|uniref:uncharacterized protein n=1 Tax=Neoarthrinium moseri TaxID=1658444 RepID=UPI001FDCE7FE|nr:uncharacterized protein JN550_003081 [Neoarthrinium moseri]KAI1873812.1 hypothetical protein JN550_003081 [Neoarthrinium moseri]
MDGATAHTPDYYGSIVALEGSRDTVSTQLRLLPSSPKILVLPPLQHFMKEEDVELPFDARSFILKIHEACSARAEMAHSFLQESSPDDKRLVFMNGGTSNAQMSCLSAISQHTTGGDIVKAERIFKGLVSDGVAGLHMQCDSRTSPGPYRHGGNKHKVSGEAAAGHGDPASEAMKAAEALYQETASLQPNSDTDLASIKHTRSMSVPLRRIMDDVDDGAPFYIFGASHEDDEAHSIARTSGGTLRDLNVLDLADSRTPSPSSIRPRTAAEDRWRDRTVVPSSPSCTGMPYDLATPQLDSFGSKLSLRGGTFGSLPGTPGVFYGEAYLVDVRSSPARKTPQRHRRIRSIDRVYAGAIRNQDISVTSVSQSLAFITHERSVSNPVPNTRKESVEPLPLRSKFYYEASNTESMKPSKTTVRKPPPTRLDLGKSASARRSGIYVDKGTNPETHLVAKGTWAGGSRIGSGEGFGLDADLLFETILPMVEDLVIHLKDEVQDSLLESVIKGFKNGSFPVLPSQSRCESPSMVGMSFLVTDQSIASPAPSDGSHYDPFASHEYYAISQALGPPQEGSNKRGSAIMDAPPTPAQTPPPSTVVVDKSFHEFATTDCSTAVCVQNSLRSILNIYFSPEQVGYHQFNFPLLPELSSVWKPVFRETEDGSPRRNRGKIDLLLAIGTQKGVTREFLSAITSSLERLGTKSSGARRSGRLDLRYLIANAMQSYTSQPLAKQTKDNPFHNPLLLATLIIPHLEMYLAAHSGTRFLLLEYPPEHLATVLALQRLVGVDLLKVAGILNAESPEFKQNARFPSPSRRANHSNNSSVSEASQSSSKSGATLLRRTGSKISGVPSFSKANFLLTSSASDAEIATLISTIWKILVDISPFYIPEGSPTAPASSHSSRTVIKDTKFGALPFGGSAVDYAPFTKAAVMMGFQSPPVSPASDENAITLPSPGTKDTQGAKHQAKPSTSSMESSRTARAGLSQRTKLQKLLAQEVAGEADRLAVRPTTVGSYFDVSEDEESKLYADERKYVPMYLKKPEVRKGNSRKALKWLGLA